MITNSPASNFCTVEAAAQLLFLPEALPRRVVLTLRPVDRGR